MTVIKMGNRVGSSEATLLAKLGIKPFSYSLHAIKVCDDGLFYDPKILNLTDEDFDVVTIGALRNITAFSLVVSFPNLAFISYMAIEGYKNILAIVFSTDYNLSKTIPLAIKNMLKIVE